jgi:lipid A 3-O-deacylase
MIRKTCVWAAALAFSAAAHALDSVSFEYGRGNDETNLWRLGAQWNWSKKWFADRPWQLGAYWDLQVGHWTAQEGITDIGFTPVFRLQHAYPTGTAYIEGAVGFHLLSNQRISAHRFFSTRFQYGDHIGVGTRFGDRRRYDVSLRLQHLSNGGLEHPNPGINFFQARLQYHFD